MTVRLNMWTAGGIVALVVGAMGGLFRPSGLDSKVQSNAAGRWTRSTHPQVRLTRRGSRPSCGKAPVSAAQVTADRALIAKFEILTDPRVERSKRPMRLEMVAIPFGAAICGADVTAANDVACETSGVSPARTLCCGGS